MRPSTAILGALLLASNAAWALVVLGSRDDSPAPPPGTPAPDPAAAGPLLVGSAPEAPRTPAGAGVPAAPPGGAPPLPAPPGRAPVAAAASPEVRASIAAWKFDAAQIGDAARRESALRALTTAAGDRDEAVAREAFRALLPLRPADADRRTLRGAALALLASEDRASREVAVLALAWLPEPGDLDRVLAVADADPASAPRLAFGLLLLNGGRAEGAVADFFVRRLATEDLGLARDVANALRGRPSTLAVQEAVVAAWERTLASGGSTTGWYHILGQMDPLREPVVRAIFDVFTSPRYDPSAGQLLGQWLPRRVAPEAQALAARSAAAALPAATDAQLRRVLAEVLGAYGTGDQRPVLAALADNPLASEAERAAAHRALEALDRRR